MGRVYLDFDGKQWNRVEKSEFWMDSALLNKLDNIKMIQSKKWDGVIIVDGPERSGKSVLGMLCGWYLSNKKITITNFALGLSDVAQKIATIPDESVLILDEGSTIFSSKKTNSKLQKNLMEILDVVGQKRLIFIIILPCFFDLNKTIAVRRSKFLLHVYPDEDYNRGKYAFWGEKSKSKLYHFGKKNFDSYAFPHAEFLGEYPDFHPPFYEDYLVKIKQETLKKVLGNAIDVPKINYKLHNFQINFAGRIKELIPDIHVKTVAQIMDTTEKSVYEWIRAYKLWKEEQKAKEIIKITEDVSENNQMTTQDLKPFCKKGILDVEAKDLNTIGY